MASTNDRTNVTDNGYTYNGQNFTNQTRTDSQGNQYTVAIQSAIPTSSLQGTAPIVPVAPKVPDLTSLGANANAYIGNSTNEATLQADAQAKQAEKDKQSSTLSALQSSLGNRGADQLAANSQVDENGNSVNSLAGKLRSINAQSQALSLDTLAKQQAEINKATGQNITSSAVQRNTSDATRDNLINTAKLAMESAIVKADYDTAKSYADQIVEAKYAQKLADIEATKTNIDNIKENLTTAQKKLAEATLARKEKEKMDIEKKMADEKAISDIGMTLRKYGVSDSVVKDVLSSGSVNDAIMKAGNNLQDPKGKIELENLRLEQILKKAEIAKVQRATSLLGQKTPAEQKAELAAIKNAKAGVPVLEDKMLLLDGILSSNAIDSVAGPTFLSRAAGGVSGIAGRFAAGAVAGAGVGALVGGVGAIPGALIGGTALASQGLKDVFGDRQNLIASVSQLTDKAFLDELLSLKERGGTLGQVTEREGQALKNAATKFGKWEIKDKEGNVVGYNVSEKDFKDEVEKMKKSTNRILTELRGSQYSADEQQVLDEMFNSNNVDASAYFQ